MFDCLNESAFTKLIQLRLANSFAIMFLNTALIVLDAKFPKSMHNNPALEQFVYRNSEYIVHHAYFTHVETWPSLEHILHKSLSEDPFCYFSIFLRRN